jgi:hypothetical protein
MPRRNWIISGLLAIAIGGATIAPAWTAEKKVSYSQDIRPILSTNCFACHGRDEEARQAELRLDVRDAAVEYSAIAPGDAESSILIERVASSDPELVMPPPDSGHRLTSDQIELLRRWIEEGAEYTTHWSFVPPVRSALPSVSAKDWPAGELDYFIVRKLEDAGLEPSPQADPYTLIRRIHLDLIGLPPTPEVADRFAAKPSTAAYERLVDQLLASPQFGEHWARVWLDLARYADTKGYEKDFPRDMWPYRDWVIRAINDDMPFDVFTIQQLAGDLLPEASRDQQIATAFHRNTMSNDEGGTDDEEFRVAAVKDRVDTTMQVWMGLTAGCAKCHSHKFDPISHKEYYQLFAIFNQTGDADTFDEAPVLRFESAELSEKVSALRKEIDELKQSDTPTSGQAGDGDDSRDARRTAKEKELAELEAIVTKLPIMAELSDSRRRTTHIHLRGNFLEPGEEVAPAVPVAFGSLSGESPPNRLAFAKWLVSTENPLTARVAVNRIWARFMGIGLVESEGDFGLQGSPPTHPVLLDWLATEFRDAHVWSLKAMCKTIVMSSTYRQSSAADAEKLQADSRNRLFSRGPRFRLPAETVRDQALSAAGLLSAKMFGSPVMPPQPPGVWKTIYNTRNWQTSEGEDRYRRAIYTYWKRTSPYPAMLIFDAESRDVCTVRRIATNTPLQALVLMNDPVYLEAAAALAKRMIAEGGETPEARLARGVRLLLIRQPRPKEITRLNDLRVATAAKFHEHPGNVSDFLAHCHASEEIPGSLAPHEFAGYIVAASVLLNLDEAITRN